MNGAEIQPSAREPFALTHRRESSSKLAPNLASANEIALLVANRGF
jgi:hypothetical protein